MIMRTVGRMERASCVSAVPVFIPFLSALIVAVAVAVNVHAEED